MKKIHYFTGKAAADLRQHLKESHRFDVGEDIFYVAQSLAFMIHDTPIEKLSAAMKSQRNRFALRKLRAALDLIDRVFPTP